jgi:hypothetical protein
MRAGSVSLDPAGVDALYAAVLEPRIRALEDLRVRLKANIARALACVLVPFAVFFFGDLIARPLGLPSFAVQGVGMAGVFAGVLVAAFRFAIPGFTAYANYQSRFKHDVVRAIFEAVVPGGRYAPHEGVDPAVFDAAGIFSTTGSYRSDDRVTGRIGRTPFEAAEVRRSYATGGKNSRTVVVFHGLFFHLDFNQALRGTTIVQPTSGSLRYGDRDGLALVTLEHASFGDAFEVYASDEAEARHVLTPVMVERVLSLTGRTDHPVVLAFKDSRAYVGVHYGRPLFEPGIAATTAREAVAEMAGHFALAELVVNELDLNTRIWTKRVDDGLLHEAPQPADALDQVFHEARSGTLTEAGFYAAVARATGGGGFVDTARAVGRPPGSRVSVEHGTTSTFDFGLGGWFWFSLLASLGLSALFVEALRVAAPEIGLGAVAGLLPVVPLLDGVLAAVGFPLAAIAGAVAGLVGVLFAVYWMLRVRRVDVDAGRVRIFRGLRPWPRTYPRPAYGRVVLTGDAVFLARSEGLSLINVSASPNLTADEARWVAFELARALEATSRLRTG